MNGITNQLAQLMAFWKQNVGNGTGGGMDYGRWNSQAPDNGATWAQGMLERFGDRNGGEKPDYFGGNALAPYVQPQGFNEQQPRMRLGRDPRVQNYLSSLLGAR